VTILNDDVTSELYKQATWKASKGTGSAGGWNGAGASHARTVPDPINVV
jgi:hypothetical protein